MVSGGAVGVALIHTNMMTESTCSTSTESTPTPVTEISDESACSDDSESETTQTSTARLFLPHRVIEMEANVNSVDMLKAFPFLNKPSVIDNLKSELPVYISLAQDVAPTVETLHWWKGHKQHLPNWSKALEDVLLVQPSSAAAERVFSMLKASFSHQQDHSLQDYIETSLFLQFNRH